MKSAREIELETALTAAHSKLAAIDAALERGDSPAAEHRDFLRGRLEELKARLMALRDTSGSVFAADVGALLSLCTLALRGERPNERRCGVKTCRLPSGHPGQHVAITSDGTVRTYTNGGYLRRAP